MLVTGAGTRTGWHLSDQPCSGEGGDPVGVSLSASMGCATCRRVLGDAREAFAASMEVTHVADPWILVSQVKRGSRGGVRVRMSLRFSVTRCRHEEIEQQEPSTLRVDCLTCLAIGCKP